MENKPCPKCNGTGKIEEENLGVSIAVLGVRTSLFNTIKQCPECKGSGVKANGE